MNNVDKYYWIIDHPELQTTQGGQATIELMPQMVNPLDNTISTLCPHLNTKQQWWVEVNIGNKDYDPNAVFPQDNSFEYQHDMDLDCGGDSAEDAIDILYDLVKDKYGDY